MRQLTMQQWKLVLAVAFIPPAFLLIPWTASMPGTELPTVLLAPALLGLHLFLRQAGPDPGPELSRNELPWLLIWMLALLVPVLCSQTVRLDQIAFCQSGGYSRWLVFSDPFDFAALLLSLAAAAKLLSAVRSRQERAPEIEKIKYLWIFIYCFLLCVLQVVIWLGAGFIPVIFTQYAPQTTLIWILALASKTLVWMVVQIMLWRGAGFGTGSPCSRLNGQLWQRCCSWPVKLFIRF
jgi:hypothetical protein